MSRKTDVEMSSSVGEDFELCDFGHRLRVSCDESGAKLMASVPDWESFKEDSIETLQNIYGTSFSLLDGDSSRASHHFSIDLDQVHQYFDDLEQCLLCLSEIRIQSSGATIANSLMRIVPGGGRSVSSTMVKKLTTTKLGSCYSYSTSDKYVLSVILTIARLHFLLIWTFSNTLMDSVSQSHGYLLCISPRRNGTCFGPIIHSTVCRSSAASVPESAL